MESIIASHNYMPSLSANSKPAIQKFAVVEYSSKTGGIWKHTSQKPNYLADPIKEIDPTSFGSYVSAFEGEHIPITHLVQPNFPKKIVKRLTGSWPGNYDISYFKKFDTLLIVHQVSDAHEIARFAERVKKAFPHIFILGVPTWPYGQLQPYIESNPQAKHNFTRFMDACDVFLVVVKSTLPWYETLTQSPVVYMPQIYPAHYATQFAKPATAKHNSMFIAGVTDRPNIKQGQQVAVALQKQFPDLTIYITDIPGHEYDTQHLKGSNYKTVPFQHWRQHLPALAQYKLVINTDYTQTRGRVQADCAAVKTPSLGGDSDGARDLFPELASTPDTPTNELIKIGQRLLRDGNFYQETVQYAQDRLQKYGFDDSVARLQLLVKQHRHG